MNDETTDATADERSTDLQATLADGQHVNVRNEESGSGNVHTVHLNESGTVEKCTCKGWTFNRTCYHTDYVTANPLLRSSARAMSNSSQRAIADGGTTTEDTDNSPKVTIHRENEEHGGALFGRCEHCGVESVADYDGRVSVMHEEHCPGDSHPDEIDTTPL